MRRSSLMIMIGAVLTLGAGCGGPKSDAPDSGDKPPKVELKPDEKGGAGDKKIDAAPKPFGPRFAEAVIREPSPEGEARPPDATVTGKNVPALLHKIAGTKDADGLWDRIHFFTPEGKKIRYTAHLKTDQGIIQIELLGDQAPNHVRNFIALSQAGYYDGLPFHRSVRKEIAKKPWSYIEAGCPKGTGEVGYGSIGYWLKPELSDTLEHEEGTVGAWHSEDIETAACKFYVTLARSPWMDGAFTIFGKIVGGLDVARTINSQPVHDDELGDRPVNPVVIRAVTILSRVE